MRILHCGDACGVKIDAARGPAFRILAGLQWGGRIAVFPPPETLAMTRLLLMMFALAFVGCGKSAPTSPGTQAEAGPPVVKVASAKKVPLHWSIDQPGTVLPYEVTPVAAKLAGHVLAIAPDVSGKKDAVIDIGSAVTKGQLLATLDIPELVAELGEKKAAVGQATAMKEQAEKELAVSDEQVNAASAMVAEAAAGVKRTEADVARWKAELAQVDDLVARRVVDAQNREVTSKQCKAAEASKAEADAKVLTANATVAERKAKRLRADADVATAAARVAVAEAEVTRVNALVAYTEVKAPFDGVVTARNVHPGRLLQPGYELFTVARLDVVRVFVDVPEVSAGSLTAGAKATVRIPALANREFAADVTRSTGVIQPDTRALRVEIDLDNKDRSLRPGMYAFVQIKAEAAGSTMLPAACVLPADETHYVFAVEGEKVVKYRVQLGRTEGASVQVFARRKAMATTGTWEPLTGAERVVVGNLGALTDGLAVQVKE